jgi:single-stranded DNA-binding protein
MKVGIELRIDVTKIEKARIYKGEKGSYLTMTTFVDLDQKDQYDNNGMITHKKEKDEQGNTPILGNCKVFWTDQQQGYQQPQKPQQSYQQPPQQPNPNLNPDGSPKSPQQMQQPQQPGTDDFDDDIPF